ncbi:hypothetical protein AVEN_197661-1 [Araneus ventricosus]|uniref:Uncharacterized protein n=1 Tax=Araneus ventricosus TaxID=182803 RepID=A0A4Y2GWE1_ARAVE|nr:hypothetical protein AVEN_197661-1 [Araneus ventricosus]
MASARPGISYSLPYVYFAIQGGKHIAAQSFNLLAEIFTIIKARSKHRNVTIRYTRRASAAKYGTEIPHLKNSWKYGKINQKVIQSLRFCSKEHSICMNSLNEITFLEPFSGKKAQNKGEWLVLPSYHWYKGLKPELSLSLPCDRQSSTCLSRLASGHLKCLIYSEGNKIYPLCPKCQQHQASPKHILDCLGLDREEIYSSPLLVIDFIKVNGFLDLVSLRLTPNGI